MQLFLWIFSSIQWSLFSVSASSQILYAYKYKSEKHCKNVFFLLLDVLISTLKWGQRSLSAIIGAFLQTVFLFFSLVQQQDAF